MSEFKKTRHHGDGGVQAAQNRRTVDRLTDTRGYTGTQKTCFDDSGKGTGISEMNKAHVNIFGEKDYISESEKKNIEFEEMKNKTGYEGDGGVQAEKNRCTVGRLTDTSRYTGTQKTCFDDCGKGTGISDMNKGHVVDGGYVTGYHNEGSYDKKE